MERNGKAPAYPVAETDSSAGWNGLTKRELFAAMAMQGRVSHYGFLTASDIRSCIDHADALLAALDGSP